MEPCISWRLAQAASGRKNSCMLSPEAATEGFPGAASFPDTSGNLYGTVHGDGNVDAGGVFELSPGNSGRWTNTILYSDNEPEGPGLLFDKLGNLYGAIGPGNYFHIGRHRRTFARFRWLGLYRPGEL